MQSIQEINIDMNKFNTFVSALSSLVKHTEEKKMDELYTKLEDSSRVFSMYASKCSIHIELELRGKKIKFLLDTGAQMNVISESLLKKLNLDLPIDKEYKGKVLGIGSGNIVGFVPFTTGLLFDEKRNPTSMDLCIHIINSDSELAILGLGFMLTYGIELDFYNRCIRYNGKTYKYILNEKV
jgi:hypothetical protein